MKWSPSGDRLAIPIGSRIVIFDAVAGAIVRDLKGHEDAVLSVSWTSDQKRLASGSSDKTLRILGRRDGQLAEREENEQNRS